MLCLLHKKTGLAVLNSRQKLSWLWEASWTRGPQLMTRRCITVGLWHIFLPIPSWTSSRPSQSPHIRYSSHETLIQISAAARPCKRAIWGNSITYWGITWRAVRPILLSVCSAERHQKSRRETQPPPFSSKKRNWHLEDLLLSHLSHVCWRMKLDFPSCPPLPHLSPSPIAPPKLISNN